ncbi:MAG: extracellular solute-binding protein [Gammaproteobacteria bacterium]|nr:extracellular solute-binding protein [Gammaproteobacteria bacterium]
MIKPQHAYSVLIFLLALVTGSAIAEATSSHPVLHVAGWDAYADPENRNKTIGYKSFEEQSGYKIEYTSLNNLDEIIQYAKTNEQFDVLIISNEGIEALYKMNLVQDLNLEKIPYYQDLHHSLRYNNWCQFNGKVYAIPWAWGPTGLLYNSEEVPEPDSWDIFWDPKYKGKVSLWNDVSMIWITALTLGYTDIYNLTNKQLNEVKKKLLLLNEQVNTYYKGEQEEMDLLISGNVLITNSWFDPSARLAKHNKQFKMVIPKEGAVGMFDSYMLSRNNKSIEISHDFINHQISPAVQLKMSHITGLEPSNIETLALMTQDEIHALHLDDQSYFRKILLWDVMPRKHLYEQVMQEILKNHIKTDRVN